MLPLFSLLLVLALSEERPVVPLRDQPASARNASIVTNGRTQLIAWKASDHEAVYVQLLDETLASRATHGILLGRPETGALELGGAASDRDGYLVAWNDERKVWATPVSGTGEVAEPVLVTAEASAKTAFVRVASNGRGYLVTWSVSASGTTRMFGRMLDRTGAPLGDAFPLLVPYASVLRSDLASDGDGYLAAFEYYERIGNSLSLRAQLIPVSAEGVAGTPQPAPHYLLGLTYDGTTYLLFRRTHIVNQTYDVAAAPADRDGKLGTWQGVANLAGFRIDIATIASNGNGTLLGLGGSSVVRLAPGGAPLDLTSRNIPNPMSGIALGPAPNGQYFMASTSPLAGARLPDSLLTDSTFRLRTLAQSPIPQKEPRVAAIAGGPIVTYREGFAVRANGAEVTNEVRTYSLASDGTRALVTWTHYDSEGIVWLRGRWVGASGPMSAPFLISQTDRVLMELTDSVAVDGGIVVVWEQEGVLARARIGGNDAPLPFNLTTYPGSTTWLEGGAVARTARGFLLAYTEIVNGRRATIRAVPFRADLGHDGPMQTIADTLDFESTPDLASDGEGRVLAVWAAVPLNGTTSEVRAALLAENGSVIGPELVLGAGTKPRVSWTGSTFVVLSGTSLAAVSRDGQLLQPLTPMLGNVLTPAIEGNVIAYTKNEQMMLRTVGEIRRRRPTR